MTGESGASGRANGGDARPGWALALAATLTLAAYSLGSWVLTDRYFLLATPYAPYSRDVGTLVQGLVLVIIALVAMWRPRLLRGWMFRWLPLALLAVGVTLVATAPEPRAPLVTLGLTCVLAVSSFTIVSIGCLLAALPRARASLCALVGLLVSYLLRIALAGLAGPLAVTGTLCALEIVTVALPSGAAARVVGGLGAASPPGSLRVTNPFSFLPLTHQLFVCLLIFRLSYGFSIGFGEIGSAPVATVAGAIPLTLLLVAAAPRRRLPQLDTMFNLALLLVLAGYLAVSLAGAWGASLPSNLLDAGSAVFMLVYWVCVVALARRNEAGTLTLFAWGGAVLSVGVVGGAWLGRAVDAVLASSPSAGVVTCNVLVVCLAAYALFGLKRFSFDATIAGLEPSPRVDAADGRRAVEQAAVEDASDDGAPPDALAERVGRLAREAQLTPRETEVFGLLAQGRDGGYIQRQLGVSYNTIKTHVAHIYTKLDVHNHQELIDLVRGQGRP